jgi:hypothetical protein
MENLIANSDASKQEGSAAPLSENDEGILERRMVWLFGAPRSGTTWLATQLLAHPDNVTWNEPFIGYHLGALTDLFGANPDPDWYGGPYFFSPHHKDTWAPLLRKLILARTFAQVQTLTQNVIIKEPNGIGGAPLIISCLPNSKIIFLLRDGRDVIESLIDAHSPNSWNKHLARKPLTTRKQRLEAIAHYAEFWKTAITAMWKAFHDHSADLRLLLRYQELKANTPQELKRIYSFLNISIPDDDVQRKADQYSFERIPSSEKGPGKFNRAATTGGWRSSFSKGEQKLMNSIMGEALQQTGFAL